MNRQPDVSVITPTKNRLNLLCEAIDSVSAQSFAEWELLVVDDGSDDGTAEEVERRSFVDSRIRYFRRNGDRFGANVCRNIGIRESRADLLVFLDSDDLLSPHCLRRRTEVMRRNLDLDFAVFRADVFVKALDDLGRLYHSQDPGDDLLRFLVFECPWQTSGPVWRRGFLERIGYFDEALLSMQDLEMHVRALSARGTYVCFPEVDHHIRWQNDESKTSVRHFQDPAYIQAAEKTPAKLRSTLRNSSLLTWTRQRGLTGLYFRTAESWMKSGRLRQALRAWNNGCEQQEAPLYLQIMGIAMLCTGRLGMRPEGVCSRFVNKWKGWVRFRPE